ncbi:hypothetical protein [Variovorax sp. YR566]|uniref:hypothetical protein n=1 Tax=Variovorax sp. YR566 TaxID=3450237 RepID=UPI003F80342E
MARQRACSALCAPVAIAGGLFDDLLKGLDTPAMDAVIGVLDARAHQPQLAHHVLFDDRVLISMES